MSSSPVIIYRYDASPYSVKVDNILVLKNIPHQKVNVLPVLPRPEITDLLGITYRRIPILAIGNDVYCDTSLIASALERRFPASAGYGTIFPKVKNGGGAVTGLAKASSKLYDTALFPHAANLLPWEKFPPAFLKDRSLVCSYRLYMSLILADPPYQLSGTTIKVEAVNAAREASLTALSAHLVSTHSPVEIVNQFQLTPFKSLLEEQFQDGREYLFDTEQPSLADASAHFILSWVRASRPGKALVDASNFPHTVKASPIRPHPDKRGENHKRGSQPVPKRVTGEEAAASIVSSSYEPYDVVGFNVPEAARLSLKLNDQVQIAPDDTGRDYPTVGKLVGISRDEVVIEVQGSKGLLRCHFPRLGFTVKAVQPHKL
ncbi:hypothetical protein DXG03_002914 [Asterophora parasitica]|uniref:GST N-terminal domain-containing protein n=1 Tax=Asterophora parasitica TaxID=117018 RepID=A0A9P7GC53_9AGAR|nr:hypothetical protein DXG03_002914 [Asterophora parasitica]